MYRSKNIAFRNCQYKYLLKISSVYNCYFEFKIKLKIDFQSKSVLFPNYLVNYKKMLKNDLLNVLITSNMLSEITIDDRDPTSTQNCLYRLKKVESSL